MKKLEIEKLVEIHGGGKNRSCMLMGGLAFASALGAWWNGWGAATAIAVTAGAIVYGCFD